MARGNELTLLACEGRIVDREGHLHRGLADLDEFEGLNAGWSANGISDRDILAAREAYDISDLCLGNGNALETVELIDGNYLSGARLPSPWKLETIIP